MFCDLSMLCLLKSLNRSIGKDCVVAKRPVAKKNNKQRTCSDMDQKAKENLEEKIELSLLKTHKKEKAYFQGPQQLNLEMNIYEPGYQNVASSGIWKVFHKLRRLTGSKEIILEDIFGALDPRGTGKLSTNVFISALMGSIGYHATLTRLDIDQLAHFYTDKDTGNVDYRAFIDFVQQAEPKGYEGEDVEVQPMLIPHRHSTTADTAELEILYSVLEYIASVLLFKRTHLDPFLRENESAMKSRHVTIPQLKKVFIKMGIFLDDQDFTMLCKWFGRNAFQIDTSLLLSQLNKAIQSVSTSGKYNAAEIAEKVGKRFCNTSFPKINLPNLKGYDVREFLQTGDSCHGCQEHWTQMSEGVSDLVVRLQKAVHANHIIARPRFQQFDHLNTGRITIPQFKRGLDECAINIGGKTRVFVTQREIQELIDLYSESYDPGFVMWRAFINDIESGTCIRDLHKHPSVDLSDHQPMGPRKEVMDLPCKYSRRKNMTLVEHRRAERALEYVKHQLQDCDLYQFFRAFDKENRLHITRNQFREVMRMSNVALRGQDVYDLELYFIDYNGFCYILFLQVLGAVIPPPGALPAPLASEFRKHVAPETGLAPYQAEGSTGVEVLTKIKNTVFERGLRLKYFFESFDKFNSGVMDDPTFIRALSSAHNWTFTYSEFKKLIDLFRRPLTENIVEYQRFLNVVDEMYTQFDLERSPLVNPVPYQGRKEPAQDFRQGQWAELGKAVNKVIQQGICLDHLTAFKDMDRNKTCSIPHHKYLRAMETLGVLKYLSEHEQNLIFNAFSRPVYHEIEFDYTRFLKACHHVCRPPFLDEFN